MSVIVQMKLQLKDKLEERTGTTNVSEWARRLNIDEKSMRRILDTNHRTHADTLEKHMNALGYYYEMTYYRGCSNPKSNL